MVESINVIICAIPGVKLGDVIKNFKQLIEKDSHFKVTTSDIEDHLKKHPEIKNKFRSHSEFDFEIKFPTMKEITWEVPRTALRNFWNESTDFAIKELNDEQSEITYDYHIKILTCHLVYYDPNRRSHYSLIDIKRLENFKAKRFICLIDDIYDIYNKLRSSTNDLFYPHLGKERDDLKKKFKKERKDYLKINKSEYDYLLSIQIIKLKIDNLLSILEWRLMESTIGENLAYQLDITDFNIISVKQSKLLLLKWILFGNRHTIYLSHAISRHRRSNHFQNWFKSHVTGIIETENLERFENEDL